MDNRFGDIETFLMVAGEGSFAAAAKALRLTPSAVSRSIARLEQRLGVALVRRTTRALALTREGQAYHDRMTVLICDMMDVEAGLGEDRNQPRGLLRINASPSFGVECLIPLLPRFAALHPAVTVDLSLSDTIVDLVEARADIAIRIGPLRDTRLRAKKLGHSRMALVASPDYLARRGTPQTPDELEGHDCLRFSFRRSVDGWPFRIGKRVVQRPVQGRYFGNSGEVVRQMAVAGCGIARHGYFHVASDLKAGRLVEVLADYNPGDGEDIHALYAAEDRSAARVRAFLDFLDEAVVIGQ
ncbi:MAG TPA: LysR family transcriptional regulator [Sphingobium sp.]|jgi:DNA-binding transcriptional LysR family regulator|uniref:LysR family transcriptional regulator n=1 Tax=unclassified Sphingobium TaxID=2611147 RepID=UPI0007F45426|nr:MULTISPECIES: LysR family transcriptional regulator [unclassified Sphingobium]OAN59031.1 LysR family transcriptional regulator [Sphingobium sp. TCM1]WIW89251.1 LysR family transcriptional regulator [Sphingobium sp. V4]HAF40771.1 LysR family transcriptional regulator [Sphingobium sp.]